MSCFSSLYEENTVNARIKVNVIYLSGVLLHTTQIQIRWTHATDIIGAGGAGTLSLFGITARDNVE